VTRILVTPRSLTRDRGPGLEPLARAGFELVFASPSRFPDEDELIALLPGCVGYLAGVEPIGERVLAAATELVAISRNGVGTDNVDLVAAERLGISVRRAAGANSRAVAELTLALILASLRHVPHEDALVKSGSFDRLLGREAGGRTLGLVGCGAIGKLVAQFGLALGLRVLAYDVSPDETFEPGGDFRFATLDELLAESDVVSLHSPPLSSGRPLLAEAELARLRPGVALVNTARAGLVDRTDAVAPVVVAHEVAAGPAQPRHRGATHHLDHGRIEPVDGVLRLQRDAVEQQVERGRGARSPRSWTGSSTSTASPEGTPTCSAAWLGI